MSSLNRNRNSSTDSVRVFIRSFTSGIAARSTSGSTPTPASTRKWTQRAARSSSPSDWMYRLFSQVSFSVSKAAGFDDTRVRSNASIISAMDSTSRSSPGDQPSSAR